LCEGISARQGLATFVSETTKVRAEQEPQAATPSMLSRKNVEEENGMGSGNRVPGYLGIAGKSEIR
jgi:hypothetical protein